MMTIARYKRHENGLCAKQTKETFFQETFLNVASLPVCTPSICQVCLALPLLDITHCLKKQHQRRDCQTQSYCQLDNHPALPQIVHFKLVLHNFFSTNRTTNRSHQTTGVKAFKTYGQMPCVYCLILNIVWVTKGFYKRSSALRSSQ